MKKSEKQLTNENLILHLTKPLLKTVLENLPIFVFSVNKKGKFIFFDGKALSSIDIKPNELIGLSVFDFYKDTPEIIYFINDAFLGKTCKGNILLKGISFDLNISPIFDLEQNIIGATGLFTDISYEKDSKLISINNQILLESQEYKRSNKLLEESQSIAKLGGWELDLITKELYWTPQTYLIHDTSPEEFNPTVDAGVSFYLPESKKLIIDALDIAITQGKGFDLYLEIYTTKGRKIDVRATCEVTISYGKSIKLTGIFQDITEKKKIEKELKEIEDNKRISYYSRSLIEASLDPFVTISIDGKITDVNSATENATGLLRNSLIGTYFSDYFTEPEKAKIAYRKVFEEGFVIDFPLTICHISNKFMDVLYNANLYYSENGEVLGVFAAARDITKRKEAERKSKIYLDELIIANEDLKQFAYISSHELQSPLNTISNYIHLFKEDYFSILDDKGIKYLNTIESTTKRMSALLNSLLRFSQLGRNIKLTNVDIGKLIYDVLIDLDSLIKNSHSIIEVSDMPKIKVYEVEIRQLFNNLISNAIKFQKKNIIPKIQITSKNIDDKWVFSIKDNGIGIDPNHFDRIFDIFQRLHINEDEYKGSGVGLAYCKKIVNIHQGEIWIESTVGNGSTFHFSIPNKDILNVD